MTPGQLRMEIELDGEKVILLNNPADISYAIQVLSGVPNPFRDEAPWQAPPDPDPAYVKLKAAMKLFDAAKAIIIRLPNAVIIKAPGPPPAIPSPTNTVVLGTGPTLELALLDAYDRAQIPPPIADPPTPTTVPPLT